MYPRELTHQLSGFLLCPPFFFLAHGLEQYADVFRRGTKSNPQCLHCVLFMPLIYEGGSNKSIAKQFGRFLLADFFYQPLVHQRRGGDKAGVSL